MNPDNQWRPVPPNLPTVNTHLGRMNGLQRATEALRYGFLCFELWMSPDGSIREWMRHNARVGVFIVVPSLLVMPVVGFVLWQISGWLSMLTNILGRSIVVALLLLLGLLIHRIFAAFIKR